MLTNDGLDVIIPLMQKEECCRPNDFSESYDRKDDDFMVERKIKLTAKEDVKEFVNEASKCDFDIDIFYNRVIIDAKSILGVLSMDLTRILTVRCNGHDEKFNSYLDKFAVA